MNGVLLDTCTCIELFRSNRNILNKLNNISRHLCYVSEIVVAELYIGAERSTRRDREIDRINSFISKINILPISNSIRRFAKEKARLQKAGMPIENFDLLIGVSAVENCLTLITDNVKHMARINDIEIENWR
ncbi:MAG: PIN domain-containing protein [Paludibacteraceae bacterium]|nr:PIN domain-containing protein [Paludibacteraceae bacterium]